MAKEYTQTVKPVSRIAERIFGWLGWLLLLAFTAGILFFSLVTMNDPATISSVTTDLEAQLAQMDLQGADPQAVIDLTLGLMGNFWMIALYLVLPLIVAIIGLLNMRRRILAGILLLLAAILASPLLITLISSLFFVIAAILLFARKDLVVKNEHSEDDAYPHKERNEYRPEQDNRTEKKHVATPLDDDNKDSEYDYDNEKNLRENRNDHRPQQDNGTGHNRVTSPVDDDVKIHHNKDSEYGYNNERNLRDDDIESTRKFSRIDDEGASAVDSNIDSRHIDRPVTEREYDRQNGVALEELNEIDRENPARTRRENVDRRNRK